MTRSGRFVAWVTLLCLVAASRAQAEKDSFDVILTGGAWSTMLSRIRGAISDGRHSFFDGGHIHISGFGLHGLSVRTFFRRGAAGMRRLLFPGRSDRYQRHHQRVAIRWRGPGWPGVHARGPPDAGAIINIFGGPITVPAFDLRGSGHQIHQRCKTQALLPTKFGRLDHSQPYVGEGRVSLTFAPASEGPTSGIFATSGTTLVPRRHPRRNRPRSRSSAAPGRCRNSRENAANGGPLFSCQRARRARNCVPSFEREARAPSPGAFRLAHSNSPESDSSRDGRLLLAAARRQGTREAV